MPSKSMLSFFISIVLASFPLFYKFLLFYKYVPLFKVCLVLPLVILNTLDLRWLRTNPTLLRHFYMICWETYFNGFPLPFDRLNVYCQHTHLSIPYTCIANRFMQQQMSIFSRLFSKSPGLPLAPLSTFIYRPVITSIL